MLNSLEDLLNIDTDANKAVDNKKLLSKIKQLIKESSNNERNLDLISEELPYSGVAVVGYQVVKLKFDIKSRQAVVEEVIEPDVKEKYMAFHEAGKIMNEIKRRQ